MCEALPCLCRSNAEPFLGTLVGRRSGRHPSDRDLPQNDPRGGKTFLPMSSLLAPHLPWALGHGLSLRRPHNRLACSVHAGEWNHTPSAVPERVQ